MLFLDKLNNKVVQNGIKKQFTLIGSLMSYFAVSLTFAQNIVVEATRHTSQSESSNVQNLEKNVLDEKLADDALEKANQYLIARNPHQTKFESKFN